MSVDREAVAMLGWITSIEDVLLLCESRDAVTHLEDRYDPKTGEKLEPEEVEDSPAGFYLDGRFVGQHKCWLGDAIQDWLNLEWGRRHGEEEPPLTEMIEELPEDDEFDEEESRMKGPFLVSPVQDASGEFNNFCVGKNVEDLTAAEVADLFNEEETKFLREKMNLEEEVPYLSTFFNVW